MTCRSDPYLRRAGVEGAAPVSCPPGWVAEPVGLWDGELREIVYQPGRHDVLIVRGVCSPTLEAAIPVSGWQEACRTDGARMWIRDRFAATSEALTRLEERPRIAGGLGRSF